MPWTIAVGFAYGIITLLLSLEAFIRLHSKGSLIGGGVTGILVIVGAALAKQHPRVGFGLILLVAVATLGKFGMGFAKTRQLWPDGVIIALSVMGLVAAVAGLMPKK
jgi:uncharacterized membrane protein (UPF0136 family)